MQPLDCHRCGNHVLVKKNSLAHTSVQWTETNRCAELAPTNLTERALRPGCSQMRASIENAVRTGTIEVADQ
ncbi:hypothetical protein [Saccharopolyspora flava]|uniref:Ferredoxin n=1 Tax=Saccharopolyspora flava TaxID=95161 RepID=A0A1I6UFN4_9PSEU|nr:hypothetical protein [Saccharopolyspora flava]SFT00194.1 hypothetical protein SAMN05660874_04883 [Saccharopolyspora flava]